MIYIHQPGDACQHCGEPVRPDTPFHGPEMWHVRRWVCRHTRTITCAACYGDPEKPSACPECGEECEYT